MTALAHIEEKLQERLINEHHEELWDAYKNTRNSLFRDVLPHIHRVVPFLTDHGPEHVINVLNNAGDFFGRDYSPVNTFEHFLLCFSILFHDVGNMRGRDGHHRNIAEFYYRYRGTDHDIRQEKTLVTQIVGAHSGENATGTTDTLYDLGTTEHLYGAVVNAQHVATILRFADELAEGPRRTSKDLLADRAIDDGALKYHLYALSTNITIDRGSNRIGIDYHIDFSEKEEGGGLGVFIDGVELYDLPDFMTYISERIVKLDTERKYAKYYSPLLNDFKEVSIRFHFWHGSNRIDPSYGYILDDKVLPGSENATDHYSQNDLNVDDIYTALQGQLGGA